jgi:transposase-like protein
MSTAPLISHRRQHSAEFKQELVALCQPGTSVSAVALAHGINANLLRQWIKRLAAQSSKTMASPTKLVPVQVNLPTVVSANDAIEISIQKNSARVTISWPGHQAKDCSQWLIDWLK